MSDLFGISHASHSHPLRTLRVHVHRLAGLQLWTVTKYAAGRGADKQQLQRLGMAAWLSDGNTTGSSSTGQVGSPVVQQLHGLHLRDGAGCHTSAPVPFPCLFACLTL